MYLKRFTIWNVQSFTRNGKVESCLLDADGQFQFPQSFEGWGSLLGVLVRESLQLGSSRRDLARSVIAPLRYQPYRLAGGQPVRLVPPGEQLSLEVEDGNTRDFFV